MKILFCGKGGSGKSTVAAMTALAMKDRGFRVLLVDMDETNHGLHRLVGLKRPVHLLDHLGGKKGLREKMKPAFPGGAPGENLFSPPLRIDDLPAEWTVHADGIRLLVIGKIHEFGEGCACPMGGLTRPLLSGLELRGKEVVIIDAAAGIEHFGRGIDRFADVVIGVVDPTHESLMLAERLEKLAQGAGTPIYFIFNKTNEKVEPIMEDQFSYGRLIARIPESPALFMAGLKGTALSGAMDEIEPLCRWVESAAG